MRPRGGGERRAERRARTAEKEKEEEEGEEGGRRRGGEGKGVHTHIHIERWKDTTMKEEESAFARPHTLEKLQHTDDKEESRVERRKSAREERESKRVGARGDRGEEAGEGTRNGVYSSCFFLSFVDSALLCSRRGESSALCSTIRLHSGAVGREREKERGKKRERTLFHDRERNPPAHAMRAPPLILRFNVCIGALSRKYLDAGGCREVSREITSVTQIYFADYFPIFVSSPEKKCSSVKCYTYTRAHSARRDTCCASIV